jgi:hypothetical protein
MKHNSFGDPNMTKQNKLPCFIDNYYRKKNWQQFLDDVIVVVHALEINFDKSWCVAFALKLSPT